MHQVLHTSWLSAARRPPSGATASPREVPPPEETTKAAQSPADEPDPDGAESRSFRLIVVDGLDVGRELRVGGGETSRLLVGKGPTADLKLVDPAVSRRHLALEIERGRLRITDLGSTNGTRMNGLEFVDAYARGGEIVRVGSTSLRVERLEQSAEGPSVQGVSRFARVIGASPPMRRLYPVCERLAASSVPVIIEGETGTGKEALAEAIHEAGPRAANPFIVFDCTSVAASLVESELFGHERGAFTGASTGRKGMFELAEGGTLLIDEIGDLDLPLQSKLLRAVERSEVRRVGASRSIRYNVRLLVATRRDLEREVQQGRFRDDLFHRLAVARVELPPLRKRREDIPLLARHFWQSLGGAPAGPPRELVDAWTDRPWPGNVRELRNAVARHLALGDLDRSAVRGEGPGGEPRGGETARASGSEAEFDDLEIADVLAMDLPYPKARRVVLESFVRRYVARALRGSGGNVAQAAASSGIARRYFQLLRDRREK
jgi:two-component system, NtrC family, response regulator HydG